MNKYMNWKMLDIGKRLYYLIICMFAVGFFLILGQNEVILTKDSLAYIEMQGALPAGYIIYPAFVRFLNLVFGEEYGLTCVWIVQSILAFTVSVYVTEWIRIRYKLSYVVAVICYLLNLLPYAYTLPEYVVTHEVMTEGLAIPIFNLLFVLLIRWRLDKENKILLVVAMLLMVLVITRPQLLTILVAVIGVFFWEFFRTWTSKADRVKRKLIYMGLVAVSVVFIVNVKPIMMHIMEIMPQFSHAVSGKVLSTIELEDRYYFTGIEQEAFDYVYKQVDKEEKRIEYIKEGIFESDNIMTLVNYNTKYHLLFFHNFCEEKEPDLQIDIPENSIRNNVINTLFIKNFSRYLGLIFQLLPYSFVASIFIQPDSIKELCYLVTAFLYLFSVIICLRARKKVTTIYTKPFGTTMIILVINALITNTVFYAQQRYVIYTFGWYYVSLLLLIIGHMSVKSNETEGV